MIRPRPAPLLALGAFAMAMGWLEAVVVVYIRGLLGFVHGSEVPAPDVVFEHLRARPWLLPTEQTREAATIVMLAAAAWWAGATARARAAAFLLLFGAWDISYYLALYALIRWPPSLTTMDLLFLIPPHPWWYQPVWVPVTISCAMIVLGLALRRRPPA